MEQEVGTGALTSLRGSGKTFFPLHPESKPPPTVFPATSFEKTDLFQVYPFTSGVG